MGCADGTAQLTKGAVPLKGTTMSKFFASLSLVLAAISFAPVAHAADSAEMKALKAEIKAEKKAIKDVEKMAAKLAELAELRKQREALGAPAPTVPAPADKGATAPTMKKLSVDL